MTIVTVGSQIALLPMNACFLLFPHNLFRDITALQQCGRVVMVEEFLFFKQYRFHQQKLVFHRASMKAYADYLHQHKISVSYINATDPQSDIRQLIPALGAQNITQITLYDPCDDWLLQRIKKAATNAGISLTILDNPIFLTPEPLLHRYQESRKTYFQTDFYVWQRKQQQILVDESGRPLQGKWSFDSENRLRYPKEKKAPLIPRFHANYHEEAATYVAKHFKDHYGTIDANWYYPVDFNQAEAALTDFLENRFAEFGIYEDAIAGEEVYLHHSVLSPLLNTGLLLPRDVLDRVIGFATDRGIPFNSLEGFVRQVLGWREFVRLVYVREGSKQRTRNYWGFTRKIPASFYTGETGILPVDDTIRKLNRTAYTHHIERLMVLSNFMLLCEFDPDEVYRWFMEMYIDAYDWVMVPNVYGMAQFADGGLMCTKPYISSSNYLFKMSDYKKGGAWAETWDALFWRFMHVHRDFFETNPRLGMLLKTFDKWPAEKRQALLNKAADFLGGLDRAAGK